MGKRKSAAAKQSLSRYTCRKEKEKGNVINLKGPSSPSYASFFYLSSFLVIVMHTSKHRCTPPSFPLQASFLSSSSLLSSCLPFFSQFLPPSCFFTLPSCTSFTNSFLLLFFHTFLSPGQGRGAHTNIHKPYPSPLINLIVSNYYHHHTFILPLLLSLPLLLLPSSLSVISPSLSLVAGE